MLYKLVYFYEYNKKYTVNGKILFTNKSTACGTKTRLSGAIITLKLLVK